MKPILKSYSGDYYLNSKYSLDYNTIGYSDLKYLDYNKMPYYYSDKRTDNIPYLNPETDFKNKAFSKFKDFLKSLFKRDKNK